MTMPLPSRQSAFASALRAASGMAPTGYPVGRLAIYRNNRIAALTESLAATYPATRRIVGESFFRAMTREFIVARPPRSPVLLEYGEQLPSFIAAFEPAASLPYLCDVARIEWAWMQAYHSADKAPLAADALLSCADDSIAELTFTLHPSVTAIRSPHPAGTIWQMNCEGETPEPIGAWSGEDILIARPRMEVIVRIVDSSTALFLAAIGAGLPLGRANDAACAANTHFDLTAQLAAAFALGLIAGIHSPIPEEIRL